MGKTTKQNSSEITFLVLSQNAGSVTTFAEAAPGRPMLQIFHFLKNLAILAELKISH